eukprot:CAMPEP_0202870074 /NCGR_PEP_ID=MMETSP1391-20130828/14514_1 /ASSEMBLY_ACC=CAM_ASM_000867 /TAXON_ID=1034604 /ORGANISM="Chlamydomonas leiostraca, Strain SAG 11-49" /LENGTH=129 /DNA_ID=CAMNT_0049550513 /DNA_START=637 /DNA_END=1022 /DNA_ORIENTATION=+
MQGTAQRSIITQRHERLASCNASPKPLACLPFSLPTAAPAVQQAPQANRSQRRPAHSHHQAAINRHASLMYNPTPVLATHQASKHSLSAVRAAARGSTGCIQAEPVAQCHQCPQHSSQASGSCSAACLL